MLDAIAQGNIRPPQGIYEASVQKNADLGYKIPFYDGRVYVYAKAGAALTVGNLIQAPVVDGTNDNSLAVQTAVKADDREIKLTIPTGHASFAANAYEGGWLIIEAGTEIGLARKIKGNTAFTTGAAATVTFYLRDKVGVAIAIAGHTAGIIACPYNGVISNAGTGKILGGAPVDVTDAYYFWLQVRGVGPAVATAAAIAVTEYVMANGVNVLKRATNLHAPIIGQAYSAFTASEAGLIYYMIE